MMHPYFYREYPKEHHKDLLKEAELHRMLREKGSKRGDRFNLIKLVVGKVENVLTSVSFRSNERHSLPFGGKFKEV
ncbi:MAG: hypothetical protein PVF74_05985 [Anaerolineales bacterium]